MSEKRGNTKREFSLLKTFLARKSAFDITKFTTLDFKDYLACIIWFAKCNMRCPYCYNTNIVEGEGLITNRELLSFLESRIDRLDGVVLSGGECTLNPDILRLCNQIQQLGFKIKIDTNGLNPKILEELIDYSVVDFIALDYKAPAYKFKQITHTSSYEKFSQTLTMLIEKKFPFEVRTTVHVDLLDEEDINAIIDDLSQRNYSGTYYLQNYLHVSDTIGNTNEPSRSLKKDLLSKLIPIEFRN